MGLRRGRPPSGEHSPRRGAISRGPCLRDGRTRGAPGRLRAAGYEQASSLLLPPPPAASSLPLYFGALDSVLLSMRIQFRA